MKIIFDNLENEFKGFKHMSLIQNVFRESFGKDIRD